MLSEVKKYLATLHIDINWSSIVHVYLNMNINIEYEYVSPIQKTNPDTNAELATTIDDIWASLSGLTLFGTISLNV